MARSSITPGLGRSPRRLLPLLLVVLAAGWVAAGPVTRYLRLRSAAVRSKPSLEEGETKARAYLGRSFEVLESKGDWVKVRFYAGEKEAEGKGEKVEGWVHDTALAGRPISPAPEGASRPWLKDGAQGIERAHKTRFRLAEAHAKARRLDLKAVRSAEKHYPTDERLEGFLREGRLGLHRPDWPSLVEGVEP